MGGVYATLPAYESDIFGAKYIGANHGKMLLASSTAGKYLHLYWNSSCCSLGSDSVLQILWILGSE